MPWKIYKGDCPDCGRYTERKASSWLTFRCVSCGLEAAARAAYEMATRQGPAWNAFTRSNGVSRLERTDPQTKE